MNIIKEEAGDLTALLKVNVEPADYEEKVKTEVKNLGKKVKLKGFREGKVPYGIVLKMYGNQVLLDKLNEIVNEGINNYLKEEKIEILGMPLPKLDAAELNIDVKSSNSYDFEYEIGLKPDIEIPLYEGKEDTTFNDYSIGINDESLNKEIDRFLRYFGEMIYPEDDIIDTDVINVELKEVDKKGKVKEDGINNSTAIAIDMFSDETKEAVLALKKGDETKLNVFKAFLKDREDIAKHILNIPEGSEIDDLPENFNMLITNVQRISKHEINQALFDRAYGPEVVNSEEEFKERFKKDLAEIYKEQAEIRLNNELSKSLMDSTQIVLPDEFLKRFIKMTNKNPITEEQVEESYPNFVESLNWSLIKNKIFKEAGLELKQEDIVDYAFKNAELQYKKRFQYITEPELFRNYVTKTLVEDERFREEKTNELVNIKVLRALKEKVGVNQIEVSPEEFFQQ